MDADHEGESSTLRSLRVALLGEAWRISSPRNTLLLAPRLVPGPNFRPGATFEEGDERAAEDIREIDEDDEAETMLKLCCETEEEKEERVLFSSPPPFFFSFSNKRSKTTTDEGGESYWISSRNVKIVSRSVLSTVHDFTVGSASRATVGALSRLRREHLKWTRDSFENSLRKVSSRSAYCPLGRDIE